MKYLVIAAALAAPSAMADCGLADLTEKPHVPDGSAATLEQMQSARHDVLDYITRGKASLSCIVPASHYYDELVEDMQETASAFNEARQDFYAERDTLAAS